ncbi:hypothetical protein ACEPAF_8662 [Sanghuangporus sanghuang]
MLPGHSPISSSIPVALSLPFGYFGHDIGGAQVVLISADMAWTTRFCCGAVNAGERNSPCDDVDFASSFPSPELGLCRIYTSLGSKGSITYTSILLSKRVSVPILIHVSSSSHILFIPPLLLSDLNLRLHM